MHDYVVLHQKTHRTNAFSCLFPQTRYVNIISAFHSLLEYATSGLVAFAWTTFTNLGSVLVYFLCVYARALQSDANNNVEPRAHAYDSYRSGFGLPFILAISNLLVSAVCSSNCRALTNTPILRQACRL